jgi:hypothetical protein
MPLSKQQVASLVQMVASTTPDEIDCDGCLDHVAEFAETQLAGRPIESAMVAVQNHIQNCHCCQLEFETFLKALSDMEEVNE